MLIPTDFVLSPGNHCSWLGLGALVLVLYGLALVLVFVGVALD